MGLNWYSQENYFEADGTGLEYPVTTGFSLDFINMRDGDTIVRTLFGWQMTTGIFSATDAAERAIWPLNIALWYEPSPTGEPNSNISTWDGDKLWRDQVAWTPRPWTDGSLYGTQFMANSGSPRDVRSKRTVFNKSTALIIMGVDIVPDPPGFSDHWILPDIRGLLQVAILVNQPGLHDLG